MNSEVLTRHKRCLQVEVTGDPEGTPVILMHGTPGSRVGPKPRASALYRQGVRLISYDRPGYGGSSRLPGRIVADAAQDAADIADHFKLDRFAVVGRSGGAPHALACAALLPDRVSAAAALVPLAPRNAPGLDWFAGMTADNVRVYGMVGERYYNGLRALLEQRSREVNRNPESLLPTIDAGLEPSDRWVIGDSGIRKQILRTYSSALVGGTGHGWFDDVRALGRLDGWGFDPAEIKVPVLLWHGSDDRFSPVSHTRWLADRIRGARLEIEAAASHFSAVPVLPELLSRLLDLAESPAATAGAPAVDGWPRPLPDPLREPGWTDLPEDPAQRTLPVPVGAAHAAPRRFHAPNGALADEDAVSEPARARQVV